MRYVASQTMKFNVQNERVLNRAIDLQCEGDEWISLAAYPGKGSMITLFGFSAVALDALAEIFTLEAMKLRDDIASDKV